MAKDGLYFTFGCVFVISADIEKVLDFEVLSRYYKSTLDSLVMGIVLLMLE